LSNRKIMTKNNYNIEMSNKLNINDEEWAFLYKKINKWSISTKHRSFSWRLYNGVLFTNKDLTRFGFKDSAKCSFCSESSQNREHLLLTCPGITEFRTAVYARFNNLFQNRIIDHKMMLFGCLDMSKKEAVSEACDLLTMLMNRNIYYNNFHENKLSVEGFANEVRAMERTEYAIAEKRGKLGFHLTKWESIGENLGYSILGN
jgi:hypothetical protein